MLDVEHLMLECRRAADSLCKKALAKSLGLFFDTLDEDGLPSEGNVDAATSGAEVTLKAELRSAEFLLALGEDDISDERRRAAVGLTDLTKAKVDCIAPSAKDVTWSFVQAAHRRGMEVSVGTINDPVTMSVMAGRGVDRIGTDKPALARSVLDQRKKMNSAERLLAGLPSLLGVSHETGTYNDDP